MRAIDIRHLQPDQEGHEETTFPISCVADLICCSNSLLTVEVKLGEAHFDRGSQNLIGEFSNVLSRHSGHRGASDKATSDAFSEHQNVT